MKLGAAAARLAAMAAPVANRVRNLMVRELQPGTGGVDQDDEEEDGGIVVDVGESGRRGAGETKEPTAPSLPGLGVKFCNESPWSRPPSRSRYTSIPGRWSRAWQTGGFVDGGAAALEGQYKGRHKQLG